MTPEELYTESVRLGQSRSRSLQSIASSLLEDARSTGYRDPEFLAFESLIGTAAGRADSARKFLRAYAESGNLAAQRELVRIAAGDYGDPFKKLSFCHWRYRVECYGEKNCRPITREIKRSLTRGEQIDLTYTLRDGDTSYLIEFVETLDEPTNGTDPARQ